MSLLKDKEYYFDFVGEIIAQNNFTIVEVDKNRPWGGFYKLENSDAKNFIHKYFPDLKDHFDYLGNTDNLSPKFLIVAPNKRLSWQYHHRRAEHWRVLTGPVGLKLSDNNDEPNEVQILNKGDLAWFPALKRHRLIGLNNWAIVVEIWQHTQPNNPSNEEDIIRVADDFKR